MDMVYIFKIISKACHKFVILYYKSKIYKLIFIMWVTKTFFFFNFKIQSRLNFQGINLLQKSLCTIAIGKIMWRDQQYNKITVTTNKKYRFKKLILGTFF